MKLLVDIGNSRIKWALWSGQWSDDNTSAVLEQTHAASYSGQPLHDWLEQHFAGLPATTEVYVASVAHADTNASFSQWQQQQRQCRPVFARTTRSAAGVQNGYNVAEQLGVDRWLALLAARRLHAGNVCVIDCGTAVTLDLLNSQGEHRGGVIAPGVELMQQALVQGTVGVRLDAGDKTMQIPARDTEAAVQAGTRLAVVGLIEHVLDTAKDHMQGEVTAFITGGMAADIMAVCNKPLIHVADLVLQGLACYSETNA
ncbi:MAG: type III pantothenate kinase [Gammaproteobacteria bacterium]